jgi:hypothetical protein
MLAIPIDPADPNYGATMRGINSAVSSGLTFVSRINAEMLRPPGEDILPKIIKLIEIETKILSEGLLEDLIRLNDKQIDQLLQERRGKLAEPKSMVEQLANLNDKQVDHLLQTRRQKLAEKKADLPDAVA